MMRWINTLGLVGIALGTLLFFRVAQAQTFIEPGTAAPGGPIASPLNSSDSAQRKAGSLIIGDVGGNAKLCLNADPVLGVGDADACVDSWEDLIEIIGGPFVTLRTTPPAGNPGDPNAYALDSGYARVVGLEAQDHKIGTVILAEPVCDFSQSGLAGFCRNNTASACASNADCFGGQPVATAGLYARARAWANDAGVFGGKFLIDRGANGNPGQLCLNADSDATCISSWDSITVETDFYVKLQPALVGLAMGPTEPQTGNAAVTGPGQISVVLTGNPEEFAGTGNAPYLCGDGQCASFESGSCPVDCAEVAPLDNFSMAHTGSTVSFNVRTSSQTWAGDSQLLIVRSTNQPLNFTPQFGRRYTVPMTIGNTKIVYANSVPQNSVIVVPNDGGVSGGDTLYYAAYQANQFPRYAAPLTASSEYTLTLTKSHAVAASIVGLGIECDTSCTFTTARYARRALLTLELGEVQACYDFSGWSGACSGTLSQCNLLMDDDKTVGALFSLKTGPCFGSGGTE